MSAKAKGARAEQEAPGDGKDKAAKAPSSRRPPMPGFARSWWVITRLSWSRSVRGRKLPLAAIATGLMVAAGAALRYSFPDAEADAVMRESVRLGFFMLVVYLVPFLFSSGAIAEEVEARTMPYLLLRPSGRWALMLGKYSASVAMSIAVLAAGTIALHIVCYLTEPAAMFDELPTSLRYLGALSLLTACYCAICLFLGALFTEASGLASTLYLAILEFVFSWMPGLARLLSMNFLASQLAGLPKGDIAPGTVPDIEPGIAALVIAVVTTVFAILGALSVRFSELGFGKA